MLAAALDSIEECSVLEVAKTETLLNCWFGVEATVWLAEGDVGKVRKVIALRGGERLNVITMGRGPGCRRCLCRGRP